MNSNVEVVTVMSRSSRSTSRETRERSFFSHHFVEIAVALICMVAIGVSVARGVFGAAAILGAIGLVMLARAFLFPETTRRARLGDRKTGSPGHRSAIYQARAVHEREERDAERHD